MARKTLAQERTGQFSSKAGGNRVSLGSKDLTRLEMSIASRPLRVKDEVEDYFGNNAPARLPS